MLRIGEFSKMAKITIKALRYYDEEGILKPEAIDSLTGYRLYTTGQLLTAHRIQALRQIGISIEEIRQMLKSDALAAEVLSRRRAELLTQIEAQQDQLTRIEFILSGQEEELLMNYQATIKELPACIVYSMETVIPGYEAYFTLIPPLGEKVMKKYPDLRCTTPEYCFVKYLDGEYREKDIHIQFCEAVDQLKPDFEDIQFQKLPAITAVSVMHKGPYSKLSNAYSFLARWIEENGYRMVDSPRESYIDGIWNCESEEDWLTEVQFPVTKK